MRVVLAGAAGVVGRRLASQLAHSPEVSEIVVTARDEDSARRVASVLGGPNILSSSLDVTDDERVATLARDADVFVCAAGPHYRFEPDLARAVIEAGTHYVSLCDDHSVVDEVTLLDAAAKASGVTLLSGCGFSPGITNLLVMLGAARLDEVDEIDIAVAASSGDASGDATTLHFLATMAEPALAIADHSIEEAASGTSPKLVYFPEPVGWVETFRSAHPEVATLAQTFPDLRSLRFRIGLTERAVMDVVRASALTRMLATEAQRRAWLALAQPVRGLLESLPPRGAPWTAARIDVRGRSAGTASTVSLAVVDHILNLAAVPAALAAVKVADGSLPAGVLPVESAFEPGPFLAELAARGLRIARLEEATF